MTGLAKQHEELFLPDRPDSILLPPGSQGLFLVQRIRDEAHRFAITAHREKRSKVAIASELDAVPGIGPARRKALLKHFGSLEAIRQASLEELAAVPGMNAAGCAGSPGETLRWRCRRANKRRPGRSIKDSPLVAKWGDDFRTGFLASLSVKECRRNEFVYKPGDPPLNLYIVLTGSVLQQVKDNGQLWLEQEFKPGRVFRPARVVHRRVQLRHPCQRADRAPASSRCRHGSCALRWSMTRACTRRSCTRRRAARMRRLPLLRQLADDQVRRLAEAVEEREFEAGAAIPIADQPGIWIVDWGQVTLTGAANPHEADGWDDWRHHAGNFIVAPPGVETSSRTASLLRTVGAKRIADTAKAHVKSRLFYLPAAHAERLI